MSAQTAAAKPTGEPVTPVIVKVGGDLDRDVDMSSTSSPVSIDSASLPFAATVAGPTWASSVSTMPGRIINLTIFDGSNKTAVTVNPGSELTSVTIRFGPARLIAMESGVPAQNEVFLLFISPEVPFRVGKNGDWTISTTHFPNRIRNVTLMVGDTQKLNHEFETEEASVQIDFDLNTLGSTE